MSERELWASLDDSWYDHVVVASYAVMTAGAFLVAYWF